MRRLTAYIHERPGWPQFRWDGAALAAVLAAVRHQQGRLLGRMEALGFDLRNAALFPTGHSGMRRITVGAWRPAGSGPMQVVSGPFGRERVHFEAPEPERLAAEMSILVQNPGRGRSTSYRLADLENVIPE